MGHPAIENKTGLAFDPAFLADEENCPLFVPIVKGSFVMDSGGRLTLSREQPPVNYAGVFNGEPDTSSYRYEPEGVFVKPRVDCVLIGHAHAPRTGATCVDVSFSVGSVGKTVRVFGDRHWYRSMGAMRMTTPSAFERIPLVYERAFGGWDRASSTPERQLLEPRNPVGMGYRARWNPAEDVVAVPNLEDPAQPINGFNDCPPPAGFGFTSPHWAPRAGLSGTYDARWASERMPKLPGDFNRAYFNGGAAGLVLPAPLAGNEQVSVVGASARGRIEFELPRLTAPVVDLELRRKVKSRLTTMLDTVIVDLDEGLVTMLWRAHRPVRDVPHDVVAAVVSCDTSAVLAEG
jgi:hypothetical protein